MFPTLSQQDLYKLDTVKNLPLGTLFYDPTDQARTAYKYVQFGGTSTVNPGLLLVAAAAPSNSTGLALNSANSTAQLAGGSTNGTLLITNGSTSVTQDQFADGDLEILGTGAVERYRILGNSAAGNGGTITLEFAGPLRNTSALVVGTNTVNLRQSASYLPTASLTAALPVGVTIMPVPNTSSVQYYGWVQVVGPAFVQATSATKGQALVQDQSGTAGYLANSAASTTPQIAIAKESASGSLASVFLQLN